MDGLIWMRVGMMRIVKVMRWKISRLLWSLIERL